jgi:Leucine-rich repeat (LRR) protein
MGTGSSVEQVAGDLTLEQYRTMAKAYESAVAKGGDHRQQMRVLKAQFLQSTQVKSGGKTVQSGGKRRSIPPAELRALQIFRDATNVQDWSYNDGWNNLETAENVFGVTFDDEGHVTELILFENGLKGQLPEELTDLSHLTMLSIAHNALTGELASYPWPKLQNIEYLNISYNNFTGKVLPQFISLQKLKQLDLRENKFGGVMPEAFNRLPELGYFDLSNNRFVMNTSKMDQALFTNGGLFCRQGIAFNLEGNPG